MLPAGQPGCSAAWLANSAISWQHPASFRPAHSMPSVRFDERKVQATAQSSHLSCWAPMTARDRSVLPMKRVYQRAAAAAVDGRHRVMLDAKPLRSPAGQVLELPTEALAAAVAAEWQPQGEEVVVATLALTRLACTVVDRIVPH